MLLRSFMRFSNRVGKPGKNVFRYRRMKFRIGITKKLIANLGPNFSEQSVKQVESDGGFVSTDEAKSWCSSKIG